MGKNKVHIKFPEPTSSWGEITSFVASDGGKDYIFKKENGEWVRVDYEQCIWLSDDFTMVCVNDKSEHCADFVWNDECDSCEYREYILGIDLGDDADV